ncbi:hypothetical protein EGW08_016337 [Elysia chlorotica]|uniref:Uncharacterized protein n=1 Tax=Elysia chlorotica TaxID=188477 RepID=A0A3S0ZER4_ELYCH|nr:hypothetical protein EGW08_016337 [Elysia chlorotica]
MNTSPPVYDVTSAELKVRPWRPLSPASLSGLMRMFEVLWVGAISVGLVSLTGNSQSQTQDLGCAACTGRQILNRTGHVSCALTATCNVHFYCSLVWNLHLCCGACQTFWTNDNIVRLQFRVRQVFSDNYSVKLCCSVICIFLAIENTQIYYTVYNTLSSNSNNIHFYCTVCHACLAKYDFQLFFTIYRAFLTNYDVIHLYWTVCQAFSDNCNINPGYFTVCLAYSANSDVHLYCSMISVLVQDHFPRHSGDSQFCEFQILYTWVFSGWFRLYPIIYVAGLHLCCSSCIQTTSVIVDSEFSFYVTNGSRIIFFIIGAIMCHPKEQISTSLGRSTAGELASYILTRCLYLDPNGNFFIMNDGTPTIFFIIGAIICHLRVLTRNSRGRGMTNGLTMSGGITNILQLQRNCRVLIAHCGVLVSELNQRVAARSQNQVMICVAHTGFMSDDVHRIC